MARAATIQAVSDCYFAVLERGDYQRFLLKLEQKEHQKQIDFLLQIPALSHWTRTQLSKLAYSFTEKLYRRGYHAYKQGEASDYVFVVKDGDFEITRTKKVNKRENNYEVDMTVAR